MAFSRGFGKNSGPGTTPQSEAHAVPFPQPVSSSHPFPRLPNESYLRWGDPKASSDLNYDSQSYQRSPELNPRAASRNARTVSPAKATQDSKRTRSPSSLSQDGEISKNSRVVIGGEYSVPYRAPAPSLAFQNNLYGGSQHFHTKEQPSSVASPVWVNLPNSQGYNNSPDKRNMLSTQTNGGGPGRMFQTKHEDVPLPKRTRSPTFPSSHGASSINNFSVSDGLKRSPIDYRDLDAPEQVTPPPLAFKNNFPAMDSSLPFTGSGIVPGSQSDKEFPKSGKTNSFEATASKPLNVPIVKRAKSPLLSPSDEVIQDKLESVHDIERELQSKAKRLARFKDELSQPIQSTTAFRNQKHQVALEKAKPHEDLTMDVTTDFGDTNASSDFQGGASSGVIIGLCPDMCPETERAERERKGDLDHYERLDGDRNLSSKFIAVKKYTRTAEREAELIRPMPILQKTMDYLLKLLDQPYDDRFLGLYNFLWDRMRAIRMDLRMQHIFDLQAISMLEQMIRLHILAMHELCEYTKGEGFSEGFDAHLNIEQMNKTSVELFQFYDDHRKKGIHAPSEREFRGYYALLKLDKHPGYKVEPAELSLDLAKMTAEMRRSPEVLFARDVARACRTGNFIAFFRLAHRASYLQACLMHAHFSKLRGHALASLHSGLQMNQGIPVAQVARWLGMEEDNIENLLEYYGFSVKDFEEPYMVKENALINGDSDYPVKRSELVGRKRSKTIVHDVSSPSLVESYDIAELESPPKSDPEQTSKPFQFIVPGRQPIDQEMHNSVTNISPRGDMRNLMHRTFNDVMSQNEQRTVFERQVTPASPSSLDFSNSSPENRHMRSGNEKKLNYDFGFRNSFGRTVKHDLELEPPPKLGGKDEEKSLTFLPIDSDTSIPKPTLSELLEEEDRLGVEDDMADDVGTSYYDVEVAEAKLKLVLRIWRRRTAKKRELRDHIKAEASAALNSLSLGPPIWQYEVKPDTYGVFDIDRFTNMRLEIQGRSWSVLNPSDVVAAKLADKNPNAKCLCWKMLLCSQEDATYRDNIGQRNQAVLSAAGSWLHSKFIDPSSYRDCDLLVSSRDLAIWKTWISCRSSVDQVCCFSVIKKVIFEDLNNEIIGSSAVLFLLSENIPIELQKIRLHDLVMSLPSGSCVPLLIMSVTEKDESDLSKITKDLGLHDIEKSRVSLFSFSFLKNQQTNQVDGFFSDEQLRGGLEWLASESPQQIDICSIRMRELVVSHLNSTLEALDQMSTYKIGPNHCILAFNEALNRSMENVATAAHANPTCWPCPEIDLLEESTDEYRAVKWYLPIRGWSTSARTETLRLALNNTKLPVWEDDISWLSTGFYISDDIENHKMLLESCLMTYLTETSRMIGPALARKESSAVLQKCTRLELHKSTYYIIPDWLKIFRRIFNWRLMNLTSEEVSSTYILAQRDISGQTFEIRDTSQSVRTYFPSNIGYPSFDELVEVSHATLVPIGTEYQVFKPPSPVASGDGDNSKSSESEVMESGEKGGYDEICMSFFDHSRTEVPNEDRLILSKKPAREADRLSELLEKCNILQNKIDKKLAVYF